MMMDNRTRHFFFLPFFIFSAILMPTASARVWYVDSSGTGDAPTIQSAIDSASAGDEIVVAPGYYSWTNQGTGDERGFIRFMERDFYVTLRSESGPGLTTLDAEYNSRVIYCHGMNHVTVEGFTITRGEAPDFGDNVGGGFFTHIPAETVRNCIFTFNRARYGGGISCVINDRFFVVEDCTFIENVSYQGGGAISLWNGTGSISISDCVFNGNSSQDEGGAIFMYNCGASIDNSVFYGNESATSGAVLYFYSDYMIGMEDCTICYNSDGEPVIGSLPGGTLNIYRTILAFNGGTLFGLASSTGGTADCSDIFANDGGDMIPPNLLDTGRNIHLDPLFCGIPYSHNYLLRSDSPCFPSNRPDGLWCQVIGAESIGCGGVSSQESSWGRMKMIHR